MGVFVKMSAPTMPYYYLWNNSYIPYETDAWSRLISAFDLTQSVYTRSQENLLSLKYACFVFYDIFIVQDCCYSYLTLLGKRNHQVTKSQTPVPQIKAVGAKRRGDYLVFDDNLKSSLTFFKMICVLAPFLDTGPTLLKTQGL